jgi:hypothetical protein
MAITKTNFDYYKNPQGGSFSSRWVSKVEDKGMFKMNFDESFAQQGITIPDPEDFSTKINFGNKNENTFFNMSYSYISTDQLRYFTAFSFSNNTGFITVPLITQEAVMQKALIFSCVIKRASEILNTAYPTVLLIQNVFIRIILQKPLLTSYLHTI